MAAILAADIGATNSRFGHFSVDAGELKLEATTWLKTASVTSFAELMQKLEDSGFGLAPDKADATTIAIAGAVEQDLRARPVNISWDIDLTHADRQFGMRRVGLINDFVAQAYACRTAAVSEAKRILEGRPDLTAALGVIGAGTGLGKCALVPIPNQARFIALPSEGGHSDFPFIGAEEFEFQRFACQVMGREQIIGDIVVSGPGLSLTHRFLTGQDLTPAQVAATFAQEGADSPTLHWAARFYGRACRNYALEILARAGIYIAGGVAAKTPAIVLHPEFATAFRTSETHGSLLADIPVLLNDNQESGLWGAAFHAHQQLRGVSC